MDILTFVERDTTTCSAAIFHPQRIDKSGVDIALFTLKHLIQNTYESRIQIVADAPDILPDIQVYLPIGHKPVAMPHAILWHSIDDIAESCAELAGASLGDSQPTTNNNLIIRPRTAHAQNADSLIDAREEDIAAIETHDGIRAERRRLEQATRRAGAPITENRQRHNEDHMPIVGQVVHAQAQEKQIEVGITRQHGTIKFRVAIAIDVHLFLLAADVGRVGDDIEKAVGIFIQLGLDRMGLVHQAI